MPSDQQSKPVLSFTRPRAWQRMLSGRRLDLIDPSPADIEIEDIAHGLARVARWNGQTSGEHAFSVAQHALVVEEIAAALHPDWGRDWRLAALLHDAPEYVIGDLISPFKAAIGLDYRTFEQRLQAAVHARFSIPHPLPETISLVIKSADRIAAYFEATLLAGFAVDEAELYFGPRTELPHQVGSRLSQLSARPPSAMQAEFLSRFRLLSDMRG